MGNWAAGQVLTVTNREGETIRWVGVGGGYFAREDSEVVRWCLAGGNPDLTREDIMGPHTD